MKSSRIAPIDVEVNANNKRRKLVEPTVSTSDRLDPVEKLLSFANRDDDFLNIESPEEAEEQDDTYDHISSSNQPNIQRMMDDNLKLYYSQLRQTKNDTSSFAILNSIPKSQQQYSHNNSNSNSYNSNSHHNNTNPKKNSKAQQSASAVPFFRTVNFNPKPASAYTFDEYLSYDELADDEDVKSPTATEDEESPSPILSTAQTVKMNPYKNMSFHYRHNDNLNLSISHSSTQPETLDVLKALNNRCILNGKASEMVSTGNLLINDFFL